MSARKTKTVLILGATSGIARALAHEYTRRKYSVILAGRDAEELETIAADLKVRYAANVVLQAFDATNYRTHNAFWKRCLASCDGNLHGVILCYGTMTPQEDAQNDFAATRAMIDSNYTSA
ncbi:MAG TPA: SDR family NAD(P)-dependent oxidoreductase, partial [Abditibacteriaceae bacterium]